MPGTVLRALQMLTHLILTTTSEINRQEAKCNQSDAPGNLGADWKDTELPFCGVKQPGGLFNAIGWLGKVGPRKHSTGSQENRLKALENKPNVTILLRNQLHEPTARWAFTSPDKQ